MFKLTYIIISLGANILTDLSPISDTKIKCNIFWHTVHMLIAHEQRIKRIKLEPIPRKREKKERKCNLILKKISNYNLL